MTRTLHLLTLMLMMSAMTCLAQPATAARLAEVAGDAQGSEVSESADFKLSDQTVVQVSYDTTKAEDGCNVHVKVYREQNGRWLMVNTVLRSSTSSNGSRNLTLPAGSYRIEVNATHAKFAVKVDK